MKLRKLAFCYVFSCFFGSLGRNAWIRVFFKHHFFVYSLFFHVFEDLGVFCCLIFFLICSFIEFCCLSGCLLCPLTRLCVGHSLCFSYPVVRAYVLRPRLLAHYGTDMIRANFNSHVWDANFLPDGEGTQWYIDWSMLWPEHQHMDRVPVGELTPELIHAFDAVLQVTHGTPSHHNDCVVANVMQPLGWASQTIVGTGRLRIPSPPQSWSAQRCAVVLRWFSECCGGPHNVSFSVPHIWLSSRERS